VRLEGVGLPDAVHARMREAALAREVAGAPVGLARRRRLEREGDDLGPLTRADLGRAARASSVLEPGQALAGEARTDPADLDRGISGRTRDRDAALALSHQQHHAGPPHQPGWSRRGALQSLERGPVRDAEAEVACRCGHRRPSTLMMEAMLS
jgi:hypothetical protein